MNQQDTTSLSDAEWVEQTLDAMMRRDPALRRWDVQMIVEELAQRPRWRAMTPEQAAAKSFDEEG